MKNTNPLADTSDDSLGYVKLDDEDYSVADLLKNAKETAELDVTSFDQAVQQGLALALVAVIEQKVVPNAA